MGRRLKLVSGVLRDEGCASANVVMQALLVRLRTICSVSRVSKGQWVQDFGSCPRRR